MNVEECSSNSNNSNGLLNITVHGCVNLCRTCLSSNLENVNTFQCIFNENLIKMLELCTTIKASPCDGLSSKICSTCVQSLTQAYSFRKQAENSENAMREYTRLCEGKSPEKATFLEDDNLSSHFDEVFFESDVLTVKNDAVKNDTVTDATDSGTDNKKDSHWCKICDKMFLSESDLFVHTDSHVTTQIFDECDKTSNTGRNKIYNCDTCGENFSIKNKLIKHLRSHGIINKKHVCRECGKMYCSKYELEIHCRKHTGMKPHNCVVCNKAFRDPRSLEKHKKIHTGEKKFECDICKRKFIHSYTLSTHKRVHTGERPFVCTSCGYSCSTSTQLKSHTRVHTQEKPYSCNLCSKAFASSTSLSNHKMTHTGERKFICSICGKGSRTTTDLKSHLRTHTGERPFECKIPDCDKKYKTHSQLSSHMKTHTGEKKHFCPVCSKGFGVSSQLKSHINTHADIRQYSCSLCENKAFCNHYTGRQECS